MDCDWMGLKHDHEIHGQFESIIPQDNKYQMSYFKKLPNARNGNSAEVNSSSQSTLSTEINFHAKFDVNIRDPKIFFNYNNLMESWSMEKLMKYIINKINKINKIVALLLHF